MKFQTACNLIIGILIITGIIVVIFGIVVIIGVWTGRADLNNLADIFK